MSKTPNSKVIRVTLIGPAGITLGVTLVALKLTGVITTSWVWVTLPFWGIAALLVGAFVIAWLFVGVVGVVEKINQAFNRRK